MHRSELILAAIATVIASGSASFVAALQDNGFVLAEGRERGMKFLKTK